MIKIQVLNSDDALQIGEFSFGHNTIKVGSGADNNLRIESIFLNQFHFQFNIEDKDLYIESLDNSFRINNIEYKGSRKISTNEIITVGDNTFKILEYTFTSIERDFESTYTKRIKENIYLKELLDQIEKEIINLET